LVPSPHHHILPLCLPRLPRPSLTLIPILPLPTLRLFPPLLHRPRLHHHRYRIHLLFPLPLPLPPLRQPATVRTQHPCTTMLPHHPLAALPRHTLNAEVVRARVRRAARQPHAVVPRPGVADVDAHRVGRCRCVGVSMAWGCRRWLGDALRVRCEDEGVGRARQMRGARVEGGVIVRGGVALGGGPIARAVAVAVAAGHMWRPTVGTGRQKGAEHGGDARWEIYTATSTKEKSQKLLVAKPGGVFLLTRPEIQRGAGERVCQTGWFGEDGERFEALI
ncbi:hypothetical protein EDC01DRAFT_764722, partial [Geopyxis carbonaria]